LFSPRVVETGRRFDDRVEIVKGLQAGEKIVVSGNFLVSSESRLQEAAEMYGPAATPLKSAAPNSQAQDEFKKSAPRSNQLSTVPRPGRRRG
jgi:Cu(I)/Ag(I) efflux system membrane fusion protein